MVKLNRLYECTAGALQKKPLHNQGFFQYNYLIKFPVHLLPKQLFYYSIPLQILP
jgi:hypothetical protein